MDSGCKIKRMDKGSFITNKGVFVTADIGKTICNMALAQQLTIILKK